jgi:hypothetical protein
LSGDVLLDGAARRMRALTGCDGCRITLGERTANSNRAGFTLGDLELKGVPAIVADSGAQPVPIFPGKPADRAIRSALLKSLSAAEAEAMRGHGVGSLMSVPIGLHSQTLGVMHCGSRAPRRPNFEVHGAAELFGQMFAFCLEIDKQR